MGNSSSSSRHGVVTGTFQTYPPPQQQQQQQQQQGQQQGGPQQPYPTYPQSRVFPPPPSGYPGHQAQQNSYNNGQYYGHGQGLYPPQHNPYTAAPPYQPPYAAGQYGQPPPQQQQQRQAPPPQVAAVPRGPPPQEVQAALTIRNQVNLKKASIKVLPLPNNPGQFTIACSFDATAPCRVSVFVNSRDDASRNRIVSQQAPLIVAKCDKGSDLKLPPAGSPPVLVSAACVKDWKALPEDCFAVVIRLEALTDEGRAEGKSLDSVEPGGELPQWVQCQTTYAKMRALEDGSWAPTTVLQKLCVQGKVFELQEIYGMEQGRPAETVDGFDDIEGNECVICMSEPRDTTALPCRHMCMCHTCANELKTQTNKCPICRNVITSLLHIKMSGHASGAAGSALAAAAAAGAAAAARVRGGASFAAEAAK